MQNSNSPKDFVVRVPARFLKDATISSDAKALRAVLGAFADGHSGRTYVKPSTLEELLGWGRRRREAAQRELVRTGWLQLGWKRGAHSRWARRIFILAQPTVARFERSAQNAQLISYHNQGEEHRRTPVPCDSQSRTEQEWEHAGSSHGQPQSGKVIRDHVLQPRPSSNRIPI